MTRKVLLEKIEEKHFGFNYVLLSEEQNFPKYSLDKEKKEALVFDFKDAGSKYTIRHSKIRQSTYKKIGFEIIS